jgi:hypothetical protein
VGNLTVAKRKWLQQYNKQVGLVGNLVVVRRE